MTMATTSVVVSVVNNSSAVSRGYCEPNFTIRVKDLNIAGKALHVEGVQFLRYFENVNPETKSSTLSKQSGIYC